jgi:hypothetical protein
MQYNLVNLTPQPIHIVISNGVTIILPVTTPARASEQIEQAGKINGIPLIHAGYGAVENLPDPRPGTFFIVSMLVRLAMPDRIDLASPGDPVRDDTGKIIGCRALVVN